MAATVEIPVDDAQPIGQCEDFWMSVWPPGKNSVWAVMTKDGHEKEETALIPDSVLSVLRGLSLIRELQEKEGKKVWIAAFQETDLGQVSHAGSVSESHTFINVEREGSTDGWQLSAETKQGLAILGAYQLGGIIVAGKTTAWITTPKLDGAKVWRINLPKELCE